MDYVAIFGGIVTALVSILSIVVNNKANSDMLNVKLVELEKRVTQKSSDNMALISTQINTLDEKVDKHNSVIERTYDLERKMDVVFSNIKEIRENWYETKKKDK